ncbi:MULTISPECIES: hypothetical protein [Brucella]|uniref:Uncharacterized protein n=11 Tax=Brucella TaxID=234 RepID=A0AAI8E7T5_BRUSS|nr:MULTISPECIES: hypothetical protein [Brucella]EPZ75050.1 hypothetical protein M798_14710 [Brucella melitensis ADMAS-G1]ERM85784.1 hypothetical protein P865_11785 [Brucella abortus 82]ERT85446.1 hypothetical protein P050_00619 [Brucella abortus 90-12178]ERT98262.1 hypothetical protein P038_02413 [Brucella abortus 99-9971-135]ERU00846.1 hypothetical protein P039_02819 [Brucella abortus 07-0994-2411]KFH23090.1 hypothetical protein IB60_00295 [Brucella abortus LMN1]
MKTGKGLAQRHERIRLAYQLQVRHGITAEDLAKILGLSEERYDLWLRRLKCTGSEAKAPQRPIEGAFERLQAELQRLLDGEQLPDKSKAEALMALAKAVKTVDELTAESTTTETGREIATPDIKEVRQALARIDRRIEELAEKRAREILGGGPGVSADIGSARRMADPGA